MNETDKAVAERLESFGVEFSTRYAGEAKPWGDTVSDHYRVSFGKFTTDFYQGIGHRKAIKGANMPNPPYRKGTIAYEEWAKQNVKPVAPSAASVLYCLLSDAEAVNQSFYDWANDLGYDTDSRKALETYEACCKIGIEFRKIFTPSQMQELRELLQDY